MTNRQQVSGFRLHHVLILAGLLLPSICCQSKHPSSLSGNSTGWNIHPDGSFSLGFDELKLNHIIPALDGKMIRAAAVQIEMTTDGGQIKYDLKKGNLVLSLSREDSVFVVHSILSGLEKAPRSIHPIASAEISGIEKFFRQGFGFSGPSGIFAVADPLKTLPFKDELREHVWSYDSYLFTGLLAENHSTMAISAFDHRDYLHRTTLYNRQHRFGLIDRHLNENRLYLDSGFWTEEITIPDQGLELPGIYIQTGMDPFATLRMQAKNMAEHNRISLSKSPRYYYCSWYEFHKDFSEKILDDMLIGIRNMEQKPKMQTIQIDDGYCWYGDWLATNDKYPSGMQNVVSRIRDEGYDAGIWVGPFMVSSNSFIFREHKEWLLKDLYQQPIREWDNEDEEVYVLDSSHPEAFNYLRDVFRTFKEWGITSYKTDFMDWGLRDSKQVIRYTPGKTSVQYFNDVLEMIREEIGEESYWLGCIAPYQPMIGYVDGMRVSNDVGAEWTKVSTGNMFREMHASQFFNNILWQNDPDVLYLRDYKTNLTDREKMTIALWDGFIGGTITTSCRFNTLKGEDLKLWKFIEAGDKHQTADLPFWAADDSLLVAVRHYPSDGQSAVLFVNPTDTNLEREYKVKHFTDVSEAYAFEWRPFDSSPLGKLDSYSPDLRPHESKLILLSKNNNPPPVKMSLSGILIR